MLYYIKQNNKHIIDVYTTLLTPCLRLYNCVRPRSFVSGSGHVVVNVSMLTFSTDF